MEKTSLGLNLVGKLENINTKMCMKGKSCKNVPDIHFPASSELGFDLARQFFMR